MSPSSKKRTPEEIEAWVREEEARIDEEYSEIMQQTWESYWAWVEKESKIFQCITELVAECQKEDSVLIVFPNLPPKVDDIISFSKQRLRLAAGEEHAFPEKLKLPAELFGGEYVTLYFVKPAIKGHSWKVYQLNTEKIIFIKFWQNGTLLSKPVKLDEDGVLVELMGIVPSDVTHIEITVGE